MDNTNVRQSTSKKAKNYKIKGTETNIEISASTYDTLMAKKPLWLISSSHAQGRYTYNK